MNMVWKNKPDPQRTHPPTTHQVQGDAADALHPGETLPRPRGTLTLPGLPVSLTLWLLPLGLLLLLHGCL